MLLLLLLSIPVVFAAELRINNYILDIDEGNTLRRIQPITNSTNELDLSNLGLKNLDENVFHKLDNVKNLNLADNSLKIIPRFVFANVTNLECLSLAGNEITRFDNVFVGLGNLRTLNLSNNPMHRLERNSLYGLTKLTDISIGKGQFLMMYSNVFEKPTPDSNVPLNRRIRSSDRGNWDFSFLVPSHSFEICIREDSVYHVGYLDSTESLASDCITNRLVIAFPVLSLERKDIISFEKGWYQMKSGTSRDIQAITFSYNNITRVTSEILNELPANLTHVTLRGNKIERLEKGIMENYHIRVMDLAGNLISEIEDGAFEKMNLTHLILAGNRLKSTKSVASLSSLLYLQLDRNVITELTASAFSKLNRLKTLGLEGNDISILRKGSFLGLSAVEKLDLSNNSIIAIEPGTFRPVKRLRILNLLKNSLSSFEKGVFDGLEGSLILTLSENRFTNITRDTLPDMPQNMSELFLDNNMIQSLGVGSFVNVPKDKLSLNENRISRIERGSFALPNLDELHLDSNLLSNMDGDSFEGLDKLEILTLRNNSITRLHKGAMKNLRKVYFLDVRRNPMKILENGALFGMDVSPQGWVVLPEELDILQGGVFNDA